MNKSKIRTTKSYMNNRQIRNKLRSIRGLLRTTQHRYEELIEYRVDVAIAESFLITAVNEQIKLLEAYKKSLNKMIMALIYLKQGRPDAKLGLQRRYDEVRRDNQNGYTFLKNYMTGLRELCFYNKHYQTHIKERSCIFCNYQNTQLINAIQNITE